jgi:hypothetical protein
MEPVGSLSSSDGIGKPLTDVRQNSSGQTVVL